MKIRIEQTLFAGTSSYLDLPFDWSEVSDWYIKWDTLFYKIKNSSEWRQLSLSSETMEIIDWRRPLNAEVYELDDDGEEISDEPLATI